jgi:hypothetical protein
MSDPAVPISESARRKLDDLARRSGRPVVDVLDQAVEEFYRRQFWEQTNAAYAELRADPAAWAAYQAELRLWDGTLMDGLDPAERWADDGRPVTPESGAS